MIRWLDSSDAYGVVSAFWHWLVAVAYLGLFGLGWYMVTLGYYDPLYTTLPHWHKSLGMILIGVVILRLGWRLVNIKPLPHPNHKSYEVWGAKSAHFVMHTGVLIVLVSGFLIPTADGVGVAVFDWFTVPALPGAFENQEDLAGKVHKYIAYGVLGVVILHGAAALKHHFVDRDSTLTRMLGLPEKP